MTILETQLIFQGPVFHFHDSVRKGINLTLPPNQHDSVKNGMSPIWEKEYLEFID